ncbi:MAG: hypothetical protein JW829_15225 [Pirellulales bacterium]|nr:hypothetical protein [Pirellulales bacterium]
MAEDLHHQLSDFESSIDSLLPNMDAVAEFRCPAAPVDWTHADRAVAKSLSENPAPFTLPPASGARGVVFRTGSTWKNGRRLIALSVFFGYLACVTGIGSADEFWEYSPYRVLVMMVVKNSPGMQMQTASALRSYLEDRCAVTAGPVWQVTLSEEQPSAAWLGDRPPDLVGESFPPAWSVYDKILFLHVDLEWNGARITAREFDVATRQFGSRIHRTTRQPSHVPRVVFRTFCEAFLPLAQFRIDQEDEDLVHLSFKGQELKAAADDFRLFEPGGVLIPIFRRNDREGRPRPDGIQQVPWTYLAMNPKVEGKSLQARIFSATKRPFGLRRRGRIEQYAITARLTSEATELHLVSQVDPTQPVAGCSILERAASEPAPDTQAAEGKDPKNAYQLLGVSDRDGMFRLDRSKDPIRTVWIKSGQLLLAKLPVVPGLQPVMEVPLPEDEARLRAEGKLTALRNNLIDLVTRRSILIVRIRTRLDAGDIDGAKRLFEQLDDLPRRLEFHRDIEQQEQLAKSNDPQTQRRIDGLFTRTKAVLGSFLDPRELTRLQDDINAASRKQ